MCKANRKEARHEISQPSRPHQQYRVRIHTQRRGFPTPWGQKAQEEMPQLERGGADAPAAPRAPRAGGREPGEWVGKAPAPPLFKERLPHSSEERGLSSLVGGPDPLEEEKARQFQRRRCSPLAAKQNRSRLYFSG